MQKMWGRTGSAFQEDIIWIVAQVVVAMLLVVALFAYVSNAASGVQLAKRVYASDIAMLLTVASHSADNVYASQSVGGFDKAFDIMVRSCAVDVSTADSKGMSSSFCFSPAGVSVVGGTMASMSSIVNVLREGDRVSVQKPGVLWDGRIQRCPVVDTADPSGLQRQHVLFVQKGEWGALPAVIRARLGAQSVLTLSHIDLGTANGVVIILSLRESTHGMSRATVRYDATDVSSERKSQKLACLIANGFASKESFDGAAFVPLRRVPYAGAARPLVIVDLELPAGSLAKQEQTIADAVVKGVGGYYG